MRALAELPLVHFHDAMQPPTLVPAHLSREEGMVGTLAALVAAEGDTQPARITSTLAAVFAAEGDDVGG
jgi:hypothetical protein